MAEATAMMGDCMDTSKYGIVEIEDKGRSALMALRADNLARSFRHGRGWDLAR